MVRAERRPPAADRDERDVDRCDRAEARRTVRCRRRTTRVRAVAAQHEAERRALVPRPGPAAPVVVRGGRLDLDVADLQPLPRRRSLRRGWPPRRPDRGSDRAHRAARRCASGRRAAAASRCAGGRRAGATRPRHRAERACSGTPGACRRRWPSRSTSNGSVSTLVAPSVDVAVACPHHVILTTGPRRPAASSRAGIAYAARARAAVEQRPRAPAGRSGRRRGRTATTTSSAR